MVKQFHPDQFKQKFIKISTKKGGSTMKIFGDELNPSIPYKTFLLSIKDTAEWIVKEMLEKYGLKHENARDYCLVQIVIPSTDELIKEIVLYDKDCPLNIYLNHIQKNQESMVFKVRKYQQFQTDDRLPMLIEINQSDGTNPPTPRIFKLHPNRTYIGRNIKTSLARQYIYIDEDGIDLDHCIIEHENGLVTVIPYGEVWYNGKLLSKPFLLQHGAVICFGRNSTFRYYDQRKKSKSKQQQNGNQLSVYNSLPILPMNPEKVLPKKITSTKFNILPGLLEVSNEMEVRFLHVVFANYPLSNIHFRLTPVYILYMTLRHRLSPYRKSNTSKQDNVMSLLYRIENMINQKIEGCQKHIAYLAYWLANISELVYFIKHDRDLSKISSNIQIRLIKHTQRLFCCLTNLLKTQLDKHLTAFILAPHQSTFHDIPALFSSIIDLFRKCRINPELTIEIFSQLFHYINSWLFNRIVCCEELKLCSRLWGEKIFVRLKSLRNWAFEQGLELPLEYHLRKINQLCLVLKNEKYEVEKLIERNSFEINRIQMREILKNYIREKEELSISKNFSLLSIANDQQQLTEELDLNIPFYLPENGYSCEDLRGIPKQLLDFIESINHLGLCRLFTNAYSLGWWTEFLTRSIETIVLNKKNNILGLHIVSVKNEFRQVGGIYIKDIIPGSAADDNGCLQSGDQIVQVDQISLLHATQEQATEIFKQSGPIVNLQILKNTALSTLFSLSSLKTTYYQSNPDLSPFQTRSIVSREDIPTDKISPQVHRVYK